MLKGTAVCYRRTAARRAKTGRNVRNGGYVSYEQEWA